MTGMDVQVLVVVQEGLLAGAISRALADAGYRAHWAASGESALDMAAKKPYVAFVVELVLPDMLGLHLVHCMRSAGRCAPVLLLGGKKIPNLVAGRPDSSIVPLPKPFVIADLVSSIRSVVSLPQAAPLPSPVISPLSSERLVYNRLEIDPSTRVLSCEGREVLLTEREYALLDCLIRRSGEVVSRTELSEAVWGGEQVARSNVLEVYINFLRRKIDRGFERKLLHTVRGTGYVLRAES